MTIEITEKKEEPEATKVDREDIKETLQKADEYEKLKAENDRLEAEYLRKQELQAKIAFGGRAQAGQQEETTEQKSEKEAADLLSKFR